MKQSPTIILLLVLSSPVLADSFPHKTAIYDQIMKGPMTEISNESYISYSENMHDFISAEWVTQKSPMGLTHTFNLRKEGVVYSLDLDTNECSKTNIKAVTDIVNDPEQFAEDMKKQMGLKKAGSCEGAGLTGVKYTSPFGEMCFYKDVFLLWQKAMGSTTTITKITFDQTLPKEKTQLPSGVECVERPDFSMGFSDRSSSGGSSASDEDSMDNQQQSPPDMEEAMKKAQEAMKKFGDMFK